MAIQTYGATAALLASDYMPNENGGNGFDGTTHPTVTAVGTIITRKAAEVNSLIARAGIAPASITDTATPVSYAYVQHLILVGTAAHVYAAFAPQAEVTTVDKWAGEWKRLRAELVEFPQCLSDAWSPGSHKNGVRSHVTAADYDDDDPAEITVYERQDTADPDAVVM